MAFLVSPREEKGHLRGKILEQEDSKILLVGVMEK